MPRPKKRKQYTEKKSRAVYIILNPITKEFYINYTLNKQENLRVAYKDHYTGKRRNTCERILDMKATGIKPCFFILDRLYSTKVEAYHHVIAWTKIFIEQGYTNLDQGNVSEYANNLFENAKKIFENHQTIDVNKAFTCENCEFSYYGRTPCTQRVRSDQHATN